MGNVVRWLFSPDMEVRRWERVFMYALVAVVALNLVVMT